MSDLETLIRANVFTYISIDKAGSIARVSAWHKTSQKTHTGYHEDPVEALRMALSPSPTLADLLG